MAYTNKPCAEHYRSYKTDIGWKLFTASEATPSLDLNITHMKGAAVGQAAYQLGYRLTVQGWNPNTGKSFFFPQHSDQLWGQTSPLFNGYQGSFLGEKRLGSEVNHHLHSRCGQRKLPFAFYCKHNSIRFTATFSSGNAWFTREKKY